jgi:hypothetical protein
VSGENDGWRKLSKSSAMEKKKISICDCICKKYPRIFTVRGHLITLLQLPLIPFTSTSLSGTYLQSLEWAPWPLHMLSYVPRIPPTPLLAGRQEKLLLGWCRLLSCFLTPLCGAWVHYFKLPQHPVPTFIISLTIVHLNFAWFMPHTTTQV